MMALQSATGESDMHEMYYRSAVPRLYYATGIVTMTDRVVVVLQDDDGEDIYVVWDSSWGLEPGRRWFKPSDHDMIGRTETRLPSVLILNGELESRLIYLYQPAVGSGIRLEILPIDNQDDQCILDRAKSTKPRQIEREVLEAPLSPDVSGLDVQSDQG
jgi:hypothetical protein